MGDFFTGYTRTEITGEMATNTFDLSLWKNFIKLVPADFENILFVFVVLMKASSKF